MTKPLLCSTVAIVLAATAGTAAAQYPPPSGYSPTYAPQPHDHAGFFGRVFLGPAYLSSTVDAGGDDLTVSGGGAMFGLAAGYSVTPNVVVFGELFADAVVGPEVEIGGMSGTASDDSSFGVGGLGVGAAYYFPSNFFVGGTLAFTSISVDDDTNDDEEAASTDLGPGIEIMGGKEWWVAQDVALGVAGQFFLGSQPEKDDGPTWHTTAFGIAVTATYN